MPLCGGSGLTWDPLMRRPTSMNANSWHAQCEIWTVMPRLWPSNCNGTKHYGIQRNPFLAQTCCRHQGLPSWIILEGMKIGEAVQDRQIPAVRTADAIRTRPAKGNKASAAGSVAYLQHTERTCAECKGSGLWIAIACECFFRSAAVWRSRPGRGDVAWNIAHHSSKSVEVKKTAAGVKGFPC